MTDFSSRKKEREITQIIRCTHLLIDRNNCLVWLWLTGERTYLERTMIVALLGFELKISCQYTEHCFCSFLIQVFRGSCLSSVFFCCCCCLNTRNQVIITYEKRSMHKHLGVRAMNICTVLSHLVCGCYGAVFKSAFLSWPMEATGTKFYTVCPFCWSPCPSCSCQLFILPKCYIQRFHSGTLNAFSPHSLLNCQLNCFIYLFWTLLGKGHLTFGHFCNFCVVSQILCKLTVNILHIHEVSLWLLWGNYKLKSVLKVNIYVFC